jgi:hypothetical protein
LIRGPKSWTRSEKINRPETRRAQAYKGEGSRKRVQVIVKSRNKESTYILAISSGISADADDPVAVDRMADVEEVITYTRMWEEVERNVSACVDSARGHISLWPKRNKFAGQSIGKNLLC